MTGNYEKENDIKIGRALCRERVWKTFIKITNHVE